MDEQSAVLQRHGATSREAASDRHSKIQECRSTTPDAIVELVARLDANGRAAYANEIRRIETAWASDFGEGKLTPLAYYRRLRRLPLDYLAHRTGISLPDLFAVDDGPDRPTPEQATQLAAILGVDVSVLTDL
jgi:hypothetical protein